MHEYSKSLNKHLCSPCPSTIMRSVPRSLNWTGGMSERSRVFILSVTPSSSIRTLLVAGRHRSHSAIHRYDTIVSVCVCMYCSIWFLRTKHIQVNLIANTIWIRDFYNFVSKGQLTPESKILQSSCRGFCLFSKIMELDVTPLVVLKVPVKYFKTQQH